MLLSEGTWVFTDFGLSRVSESHEQQTFKEFPTLKVYTINAMQSIRGFESAGKKNLLSVTTEKGFNLKVSPEVKFATSDPRIEPVELLKPEVGLKVTLYGGIREPVHPKIKIAKTEYSDREIGGVAGMIVTMEEQSIKINDEIDKYVRFLRDYFFKKDRICYLLARKAAFFSISSYLGLLRNDDASLLSFEGKYVSDFKYIMLYHGVQAWEEDSLTIFKAKQFHDVESSEFSLKRLIIEDKISRIDEVQEDTYYVKEPVQLMMANGFVVSSDGR